MATTTNEATRASLRRTLRAGAEASPKAGKGGGRRSLFLRSPGRVGEGASALGENLRSIEKGHRRKAREDEEGGRRWPSGGEHSRSRRAPVASAAKSRDGEDRDEEARGPERPGREALKWIEQEREKRRAGSRSSELVGSSRRSPIRGRVPASERKVVVPTEYCCVSERDAERGEREMALGFRVSMRPPGFDSPRRVHVGKAPGRGPEDPRRRNVVLEEGGSTWKPGALSGRSTSRGDFIQA